MSHAEVACRFCPSNRTSIASFLSALKNWWPPVFWGSRQTPQQRTERLSAVLEDWCLSGLEHRPLMALSGGELQRALLARMSLAESPILLLDEPHAALDEDGQALCWKHIHAWHDAGRTVVVVCHDLGSVRQHTSKWCRSKAVAACSAPATN